jgi:hypothetical protein
MADNFFFLQNKEYKIQKSWKVLIWVITPPLIALFIWIGVVPFSAKQLNWVVVAILVPSSIVITLWFTYMFLDSVTYRFVIKDGEFIYRSMLLRRSINFNDVRGYRIDDNYIRVEPRDKRNKEIKLSKYTQDSAEILEFLSDRFESLDHSDAIKEEADILTNNEYGFTEESRLTRLKQARFAARVVNAIGIGICVWVFIKPVPYELALYTAVVYPFFVIVTVMYYKGMIKFEEKKGSKYPSITYGFVLACCGLGIRTLDFELLYPSRLWLYSIIPFLGMLLLFRMARGGITNGKFVDAISTYILIGFVAIYSACAYTVLNCLPDKSTAGLYSAKVLEKTTTKGKTTSYYILLTPWGPRTESEKVSITHAEYERTKVGEEVQIFLKDGLLNLQWFYLQVN